MGSSEYQRRWRKENPEKQKEYQNRHRSTQEYKDYQKEYVKRPNVRKKRNMSQKKYRENNREKCRKANREYKKSIYTHSDRYIRNALNAIKTRAKKAGLDFNLEFEDIILPKHCPILGIPLNINTDKRDYAPSVDHIDNSKGYVRGNIQVISMRANRIKSDASLEELKKIVQYMEQSR